MGKDDLKVHYTFSKFDGGKWNIKIVIIKQMQWQQ